ncbi:MAG: DUF2442 domain-containing protein [Anaerolineae bacterium]|nr:DUF2442 domain-containing protein [Anaerolineae bacterium]
MGNNPFDYDPTKDRPVAVSIHDDAVWVTLADGRVIGNPLEWHPWLAQATPEQQARYEMSAYSVDWDELDEGLDIQGMLMGIRPHYPVQESGD